MQSHADSRLQDLATKFNLCREFAQSNFAQRKKFKLDDNHLVQHKNFDDFMSTLESAILYKGSPDAATNKNMVAAFATKVTSERIIFIVLFYKRI